MLLSNPEHAYRDDDPVPIELAFDHHYQGLAVVAIDPAEEVSDEELGAHLDETALPALLANSPIASMVSWRYIQMGEGTEQAPMDLGMPPGPPNDACRCSSSRTLGRRLGPLPDLCRRPRCFGQGRGELRCAVLADHRRHRHLHRSALVKRRLATAVMVTAVLAAAWGSATAPPLVTTTVAVDDVPAPTAPGAVERARSDHAGRLPASDRYRHHRCGIAEVALDPTAGSDTTASISIATMAGYDVGFRTPVAVLQGGPGGASSISPGSSRNSRSPKSSSTSGVPASHRPISIALSSTARSELVELDGEGSRELAADALDACADRLAGDLLLDATTTWNHAFDVGQVMAGLGYDRWVAYGVSYGTTIHRLLRQPPAGLVGTVLDGVYPPNLNVDTSVAVTAQRSIGASVPPVPTAPGAPTSILMWPSVSTR